jgi:hypothetical protein
MEESCCSSIPIILASKGGNKNVTSQQDRSAELRLAWSKLMENCWSLINLNFGGTMNGSQDSRPLLMRLMGGVMVCNPLLLLSPLCLLYGIYRAVMAPNLFSNDSSNTIFNFISLASYVLLVCVTSTLLARKGIVPDTTMLLLLNGLLFVSPFILIAHGVFLEGNLAMALGLLGIAMSAGQLQFLKRRLPDTFLSPQLSIGAALILAANFAIPLIFRNGLEHDNDAWGSTSGYAWYVVLPLLVAWLNFIPIAKTSDAIWSRPWFAPLNYLLWLAGTSIQLWTVTYVDDRHLHGYQFAVALWVGAWTAFRCARIFPETCANRVRTLAPISALIIPGLAAIDGLDLRIAGLLYLLNLPLLVFAYRTLPVFALGGLSLIGALCCIPSPWIAQLSPMFSRADFVILIFGALMLGAVGMIRDARAGLIAALGIAIFAGLCGVSGAFALNSAILFLFIHQLRWKAVGRDEHLLLGIAGAVWLIHTLNLEVVGSTGARMAPFVATVVVTICLRNASLGNPTSLVPPICSIAILILHPAHWLTKTAVTAPSGVLAILVGFGLLAAGAWDSSRRSQRRTLKISTR